MPENLRGGGDIFSTHTVGLVALEATGRVNEGICICVCMTNCHRAVDVAPLQKLNCS